MISQYKSLPKNWILTKIEDICTNPQYGYTTKASQSGNLRLLRTTDITSGRINWNKVPYCTKNPDDTGKYLLKDEDIVISRAGSVGVSYLIKDPEKAIFASYLIRFKPLINKRYFKFFLDSPFYWNSISEKKLGIAVPNVNANKLKSIIIPLSPLNEQTRIVEKIEELFSDLDKATEDLKKTQEQLKIYRQAVLKAAFEGKLLEMNSAEYFPFSEVCDINPSKQEIAELNDDLEVTFMPMSAVSKSGVILEKKNKKLKDVKKGYTFFKNGDVLLAKITPCFENGKKAIAKELKNNIGFGSTEFHVLRPKEKVISEWIYFGLSLEDFRNKAKSQMTGTVGQKRVPKSFLESYVIPVPTKLIQEEIINEIESRLSVCDKVEKTVEQNLSKIEYLRQSILKKAFEGKLVSQDPNDLPACELLKQIKIKKDKMSKNGK